MSEKPTPPKGRPITNKVDQIPASAEQIAKAIFRAADKKANKLGEAYAREEIAKSIRALKANPVS